MLRNTVLLALLATSTLALPQIPGETLTGTVGNTTIAGSPLGPDINGKYELIGVGIRANFIPYGASISNLFINDSSGIERDIVGGFDNASYYGIDKQHPHFGGVPGRYANRIKNSSFVIDGETYHITPNENPTAANPQGVDTLHGGPDGWDWRNWTVVAHTRDSITFSLTDPDGKEGFPGEVVSYVTYTLGERTWDIRMVAVATTKKTPIMLSSHVRPFSLHLSPLFLLPSSLYLLLILVSLGLESREVLTVVMNRHTGTSTASPTTKQPSP
jgi:aldose 1-epimerase